jgi:putative oxidoreductase
MTAEKKISFVLEILLLCFRLVLGSIFLYAGIIKVIDPSGFALSIYNYHILPGWLINPFAIFLPWIEVVVGAALIVGAFVSGASLIVTGLLFMFAVALAFSLARGLDISCGCFSTSQNGDLITWTYLARDVVLLAMSCLVFFFDQGRFSLKNLLKEKSIQ